MGLAGCSPTWPTVQARADHDFMARGKGVRTIDVMPMDIQLWTYPKNRTSAETLGNRFHALASKATFSELVTRGYDVVARVNWDGSYLGAEGDEKQALAADEVDNTVYSLSSYGHAVQQSNGRLVTPYLPHRLGQQTRSDATLYVSGWTYVGKKSNGTGKKIAKGVAIGLLVVAAVAVVAIVLASKGDALKGVKGTGRAVAGAGKAAGKAVVTVGRAAGKVTGGIFRGVARTGPKILRGIARSGPDITRGVAHMVDAFGRSHTHIDLNLGRPNYYKRARTPKKGASQTYLEMTLIDNATGTVLWHAQQRFPANGANSEDIDKAFARLMATIPRAR